jgi:hypothetical protein
MAPVPWQGLWRRPGRVLAALPLLAAVKPPAAGPPWLDDAVTEAALGLAGALAAGSGTGARLATRALAGLGAGSTPAGDDVLVGACHALWSAGGAWPALARDLAAVAAPRTGRHSGSWLLAAGEGRAAASWRSLLDAVATGVGEDAAMAAAAVAATGASSGAWSLRGFRLAWSSVHAGGRGSRQPAASGVVHESLTLFSALRDAWLRFDSLKYARYSCLVAPCQTPRMTRN